MPIHRGSLSPAQFEILESLWELGPPGATATQIWGRISKTRPVVRNTILKLVERLENRGWIERSQFAGGIHYWPTIERARAERQVVADFVRGYFGGSPSNLVMSLLGSEEISAEDVVRIRRIIEQVD